MVCGIRYKTFADIRRASLMSDESAVIENVTFSVLIAIIFHMNFTTGFTYRNLHGFVRFPGDSTVLVVTDYYCNPKLL